MANEVAAIICSPARCRRLGGRLRLVGLLAMAGACASPHQPPFVAPHAALARHAHRVEVLGGTLYVLGGFAAGQAGAADRGGRDVFAVDLATGAVRACAPLPAPLFAGASAVLGGTLYAVGGGGVARYDARADSWRTITAPQAIPDSHLSAAVVDGAIVVAGGFPFREAPLLRVDPRDGSATPLPPPPDVRSGDHFLFCLALGGRLHLLGGIRGSDVSDRHWVRHGSEWRAAAPLPAPACAKFAASGVIDDRLHVFDGGRLAHRYVPAADAWEPLAPWPELRVLPACVVLDDRLHVLGGMRIDGDRPVVHEWFDAARNAWQTLGR